MEYEAVIGLEIHVELNCTAKMFCDCPHRSGDEPNANTCPICLWLPGSLPKFSQEALEKAALTAMGLNCTIQDRSAFDQKVYYYPDLPKGFQLSQAHLPLAKNGRLDIAGEDGQIKRMRIHKIHMEEDVAKLVHELEGRTPVSLVDFNRAGAPLVEIVTEPDFRNPVDAMEFIRVLRANIRYLGTSDCSMESGTMRVDANISLRPCGTDQLNTKVEVKNMNSIRHLGDAIAFEISRQRACLAAGEPILLHTRLWDPEKRVTVSMRGKFEGPCVPDPSVPHIVVDDAWKSAIMAKLPEMPANKAERFERQYGLTRDEAASMSAERDLSEYFEAVVLNDAKPKMAAHWIATQLLPAIRERNQGFTDAQITPERFASLLKLLDNDTVNAHAAKDVLLRLFDSDLTPEHIIDHQGYRQVSDTGELERIVDEVLAQNPGAVSDYRNGATKAMGFLVGQAMQASKGKGNPKLIREILSARL